jgi:hypothetical protein
VLNWFGDWSDGALFQVYLMFDLWSSVLYSSTVWLQISWFSIENSERKIFLLQSYIQMFKSTLASCMCVSL